MAKIITIGVALIAIIGIAAAAVWWFLFRQTPPVRPPVQPGIAGSAVDVSFPDITPLVSPDESIALGPAGQAKPVLVQLTDFPVIGPSLNKEETKILFYKKDGGDLMSSALDAPVHEQIANLTVIGLVDAFWSPKRDRAALFYADGDSLKSFLHIGESTVVPLPLNLVSLSWSPSGSEFAYLRKDDDALHSSLATASAAGANHRTVAALPLRDAHISWITSNTISLQSRPSGLAPGSLYHFSRSTGFLRRLIGPFNGLQALWSDDGARALITYTDAKGRNPRLAIADDDGDLSQESNAITTPGKCAWAGAKELWCAVSDSLPEQSVFPDEYLQGGLSGGDRLVRFDFTKKESSYTLSQSSFDMSHLIITKAKDYLFFINRKDGTLWSLRLQQRTENREQR